MTTIKHSTSRLQGGNGQQPSQIEEQAKRNRERNSARILIVDDEPRASESLRAILQFSGYTIFTADGGREAIDVLKTDTFDLALLDLNMPDIDGHQVMEFIKSDNHNTSIIVISGESGFGHVASALRKGAKDFIRKPYMADELLLSVSNALERQHLTNENVRIQEKLRRSETLHRFLINNSPDLIYMLDQEGTFTFVNNQFEKNLGFDAGELLKQPYTCLIPPDDLEKAKYVFNERRTGDRTTRNTELRLKSKDFDSPNYVDVRSVAIELNSMGIYSTRLNSKKKFVGTYGVARDITERKQSEELIKYQLYHDLLTSLPNRTLFRDRLNIALAQAKRNKKMLAVLYLDMDSFKIINDTLGHLAGDELLQSIATRLKGCLREADTLARVGGDEFNLLLPEVSDRNDITTTANKILKELEKPFHPNLQEVFVTFSIGIAVYPNDGDSKEMLVKNADMAMYQVKNSGKNGFAFFADHMKEQFHKRLDIENGLRRALLNNELRLHYQPKVELESRKIVGAEALVRWQHPDLGLLPPSEFIPIAEESGLIIQVGEWVLRQACKDAFNWMKLHTQPMSLSVNLSAQQLESDNFTATVLGITSEFNLPRQLLELEITESSIVQNMEKAVENLGILHRYGIRVAVDDFGTGYSSLGYLQSLPLHTLKIDRSFIHAIKTQRGEHSIIEAVIAMAKGLGLDLIAEGVENEDQHHFLHNAGCLMAQGYLYSHPLPEADFRQLFSQTI